MFDARKFHFVTGRGSCVVKNNKILQSYLLSEEEILAVEKITPIISELPKDIDFGYVEIGAYRFGLFRIQDSFVVFPLRTENISEIVRIRSVVLDGS